MPINVFCSFFLKIHFWFCRVFGTYQKMVRFWGTTVPTYIIKWGVHVRVLLKRIYSLTNSCAVLCFSNEDVEDNCENPCDTRPVPPVSVNSHLHCSASSLEINAEGCGVQTLKAQKWVFLKFYILKFNKFSCHFPPTHRLWVHLGPTSFSNHGGAWSWNFWRWITMIDNSDRATVNSCLWRHLKVPFMMSFRYIWTYCWKFLMSIL